MTKTIGISFRDFMQIIIGITVLSLGITWFIAPLGLVIGGISGLAIVINKLTADFLGYGVPLSVTNLVLNIPLFIIIIKQRGFHFAKRSLIAVAWLSIALWFCQFLPDLFKVEDDLLLGAVFGGALLGSGIGIVLRVSATTGGTDTLAMAIKYRVPSFPIASLLRIIDGSIILTGFYVFGPRKGLYAIIAMIISSYMVNTWLSGVHFAKAAFIVSNKSQELSDALMDTLGRGTTSLKAKGMYTKEEKEMVFIVVTPKQISKLREVVKTIDPEAFVTIADVKEVLGQGFNEDYNSLAL